MVFDAFQKTFDPLISMSLFYNWIVFVKNT